MPQPWNTSSSIRMDPQWIPSLEPNPVGWLSMAHTAAGERYRKGDAEWRPYRPYSKLLFRFTRPPTKIGGGATRGYPPGFNGDNPFTGTAGWDDYVKPMWWRDATNKSYAKMIDKLKGETPELLTLLTEWSETLGLLTQRMDWLRKGYRKLRKGDFRGFLKHLGATPKKAHRKYMNRKEYYRSGRLASEVAKNASGLWLEYWFGWAPTVSDLYNMIDTLCRDLPAIEVYGSGRVAVSGQRVYHSWSSSRVVTETGYFRMVQGVEVSIANPNLFLAQSLGLVNVAATAWEILPFSFVVDWFFKLGNVISSFSDFVGLDVLRSRNTKIVKVASDWKTWNLYDPGSTTYHNTFVKMRRDVDNTGAGAINRPVVVSPFRITSIYGPLNRARTASALLTQLFADSVLSGRRR